MLMEFVFNKDKSKEKKIDLKLCYEILDDYFDKRGIRKLTQGVYSGENFKDGGKHIFLEAHCYFEKENWFMQIVDSWGFMNSDSDYILKTFVHGN